MKKLARPVYDDFSVLRQVAAGTSKSAPMVRRELGTLAQRLSEYEGMCQELIPLGATSYPAHADQTDLLRLYRSPPAAAKVLLAKIRAIEEQVCPYCGGMQPETLDHYLEKSVFPEFSIFSLNLIPSCARCNILAGHHRDGTLGRIHPYLHDFLSNVALKCTIKWIDHLPVFELELRNTNLSQSEVSLCLRHISHIRLEQRFRKFAAAELRRYARCFASRPPYAKALVRNHLLRELRGFEEVGPNYWHAILLKSLLAENRAIQYVAGYP